MIRLLTWRDRKLVSTFKRPSLDVLEFVCMYVLPSRPASLVAQVGGHISPDLVESSNASCLFLEVIISFTRPLSSPTN
jgi:hypothetical protein